MSVTTGWSCWPKRPSWVFTAASGLADRNSGIADLDFVFARGSKTQELWPSGRLAFGAELALRDLLWVGRAFQPGFERLNRPA